MAGRIYTLWSGPIVRNLLKFPGSDTNRFFVVRFSQLTTPSSLVDYSEYSVSGMIFTLIHYLNMVKTPL